MSMLSEKRCKPCEGGVPPLNEEQIEVFLRQTPHWTRQGHEIVRTFVFKDYYQTVAFVNAVAWIAHQENHHPEIAFGYKTCTIRYFTHAVGGLTENDFICAAKINALLGEA